jgi:hypothetical protein
MREIRFISKTDSRPVDSFIVRERFFESTTGAAILDVEVLWRRALDGDSAACDLIEGVCDVEIVKA